MNIIRRQQAIIWLQIEMIHNRAIQNKRQWFIHAQTSDATIKNAREFIFHIYDYYDVGVHVPIFTWFDKVTISIIDSEERWNQIKNELKIKSEETPSMLNVSEYPDSSIEIRPTKLIYNNERAYSIKFIAMSYNIGMYNSSITVTIKECRSFINEIRDCCKPHDMLVKFFN